MNNNLDSIDLAQLAHVTGGGWKSKVAKGAQAAGSWALDKVIIPGAAAVGFDKAWDWATGSNRSARPDPAPAAPAPAQKP